MAFTKMSHGSKIRMGGQLITAVASSGMLGAISLSQNNLAVASSFLAILSSIASIGADYIDRALGSSNISITTIYSQLVEARYRASTLHDTLTIQLEYEDITPALEKVIAEGNSLCSTINISVYQIFSTYSFDRKAGKKASIPGSFDQKFKIDSNITASE